MTPIAAPRRVDVAVVGCGPAGTAAALELSRLGASVTGIDRGLPRPTLGESLPPAATPLLQHLCLWKKFLQDGHLPAHGNRSTWGSAALEETDFIRSPFGNGWHLDRPRLDALLACALEKTGVPVIAETRVLECRRENGDRWTLTLQTGDAIQQLEADFLIDAGGRARQITRMLGVRRYAYDRLIGAVGTLSPCANREDLHSFTQVEAMPHGWWYASLLPDGRLAAGYMTDADGDTAREARTEEGWLRLLNGATYLRERVVSHGYRLQGPIHRVAAESSRTERVTGNGWCAAGDAACAYDPLSSQGIASALTGGIWAAHAIAGAEPGGLADYEERLRQLYAGYLSQWLAYYSLERRWPASPFWQRRHRALDDLLRSVP